LDTLNVTTMQMQKTWWFGVKEDMKCLVCCESMDRFVTVEERKSVQNWLNQIYIDKRSK